MSRDSWTPDLDSLRCFLALAEHESFRAAAAEVALSPAAFSERIRRLEEEIGAALFVRTTRQVTITSAGMRLVPAVERLLGEARGLRQVVLDEDRQAPYAIRLGTRFELGMSFVVPALAALQRAEPHRTIHIGFGDGPELIEAVLARRLDCFIASIRLTRAELAYALLHEEHYVLVASPKLLKGQPLDEPGHALEHVLIDTAPDLPLFRYFLDAAPTRQSWRFASHEYMGTIAAVRHRVLDGAGVAVLPRYYVKDELDRGVLTCPMPEVKMASDWFRLVWRRDDAREAHFQALANDFRDRPLQ